MPNLRRTLLNVALLVFLLLPHFPARAQGGVSVDIVTAPDLSAFPSISFLVDVFDAQGSFVSGLTPGNLTVLENGTVITPTSLQQQTLPLKLVVAINSGPALSVRDSFGLSRYDKAVAVVKNWAAARPGDNTDDLSLVWDGGIITSHVSPLNFLNRLEIFDPSLRTSTSSVAALSFALDVAQEQNTVPGIKPAVLFITDHLDRENQLALESLASRAVQAGVRVHIWLVDSQDFLSHPGSLALQDLASRTGGRYLAFTGSETLPDPEEWFGRLRNTYQLTYQTEIRSGGDQTVSVQLAADGLTGTSQARGFQVALTPPSALLVSPPIQIVRQNPEDPFDLAGFLPTEQVIEILIEFPDRQPRDLVRTTLYVDDQIAAENLAPPFDKFTWDLTGYQATGSHSLMVEVVDELGLSQASAPIPVQVIVVTPPGGVIGFLLRNQIAMTIVIVIAAGGLLLGILLYSSRRGWFSLDAWRKERARQADPLTQPVPTSVRPGAPQPDKTPAFPWLRRRAAVPSAYLVRLTRDGQPMQGDPLALGLHEVTFGTDPTQASYVLNHASVSQLHARLRLDESKRFVLYDQNSVAGTWVNYEQIGPEGRALQHGDVVNFGQLTYRFVLGKPPASKPPVITPHDDST